MLFRSLLPPADSEDDLNWGYGTAHFLAADFHLVTPFGESDLITFPSLNFPWKFDK